MPTARPPMVLKKTVMIFLFHEDGTAEPVPVGRSFGDYQQAWRYIYEHNELPLNAGVGELYLRG